MSLWPTRYCLVLAPILLAMMLAAINYDNNLVYFILFLLASLTLVSLTYTYRNLARVQVMMGNIWPVFAGGGLRFTLQLSNRSREPAYTIRLACPAPSDVAGPILVESLPAGAQRIVEFVTPVYRRGRHRLEEVVLSSLFPLGVIRASMRVPLNLEYLVYPRPHGGRAWPETEPDFRTQDDGQLRGGDDFYGVRPYLPGESQRHVDWKAVARGRPLMVKEFLGGGTGRLWFSWSDLPGLHDEQRLSQMAEWIVRADEVGGCYGMRLPGLEIAPSSGPRHYHRCLRALALYPNHRQ